MHPHHPHHPTAKWIKVKASMQSIHRFKRHSSKQRLTPPFIKSPKCGSKEEARRVRSTGTSTEVDSGEIVLAGNSRGNSNQTGSKSTDESSTGPKRLRVASLEPLKVKYAEDSANVAVKRHRCWKLCPGVYRVRRGIYCFTCCKNDIVQTGVAHVMLVASIVMVVLILGLLGTVDLNKLCFWKSV